MDKHAYPYNARCEAFSQATVDGLPVKAGKHKRNMTPGRHKRAVKHSDTQITTDPISLAACRHELRAQYSDGTPGRLLRKCRNDTCARHRPSTYAAIGATHKVVGW